jgi:hypothetical protein
MPDPSLRAGDGFPPGTSTIAAVAHPQGRAKRPNIFFLLLDGAGCDSPAPEGIAKMKAKDKLRAQWSKKEDDLMYYFPLGRDTKADGAYLAISVFNYQFIQQMKARGYDITTLRFEIAPACNNPKFVSERQQEVK